VTAVRSDSVAVGDAAPGTEAAIRAALDAIRPGTSGIAGHADLAQEAGLDSVGVMDLIMEIEDRLDLSIPVETLAQAHTIDELCAGIDALRKGGT